MKNRWRKRSWIVALCAGVVAAGCIPSLHPLYTDDDLIFEPALLGTWNNEEDHDLWTFEQTAGPGYLLTVTGSDEDPEDPMVFEAHLMELGSHRFLDVSLHDLDGLDRFGPHLVPAHSFYRLAIEADALQMVALDEGWLRDKIEAGEITIKHEFVRAPSRFGPGTEELFVLTASTEELQAFVTRHADDPEAFRTTGKWPPMWELHRQ